MNDTPITKNDFDRFLDSNDRWKVKIEARQEKHDHTLYGNGNPGMDEQIRDIYKWIQGEKEKQAKRAAWWDKLQWIAIPFIFTSVLAFIGQAIIFYFRILPLLEGKP